MPSIANLRRRVLSFRRSSWAFSSAASIALISGASAIFNQTPTIGLLLFVTAQSTGYFAPKKRFILFNLALCFFALIAISVLQSNTISFNEFCVTALLMGIGAALVYALRDTEEALEDARWRAETATDAADIGIFKWDFDTGLVTANPALRMIFGLPDSETLFAADVFETILKDDLEETQERIDKAINSSETYHAEFRVHCADTEDGFRWVEGRGDVVTDQRTGKKSLTGVNIDISARKAEDKYVEQLFEGVDAALGLTNADGHVLQLNLYARKVLSVDHFNVGDIKFWELPLLAPYKEDIQTLFLPCDVRRPPVEISLSDEVGKRTFLLSISPVVSRHGITNFIPYAVDITDRKNAELQNELLVAELNHRIKNLFSVVNALISLSARHASTVDDFASATISRLGALHAAHNLGAADLRNRGATLFDIFEKTLAPWQTETQRIFISGDNQPLDAGQATSWALIAHELTTNANKYGALGKDGQVEINMHADAKTWSFVWREKLSSYEVPDHNKKGFGQTVINRLAAAYLDASVSFDFKLDGLHVTISSRPSAA